MFSHTLARSKSVFTRSCASVGSPRQISRGSSASCSGCTTTRPVSWRIGRPKPPFRQTRLAASWTPCSPSCRFLVLRTRNLFYCRRSVLSVLFRRALCFVCKTMQFLNTQACLSWFTSLSGHFLPIVPPPQLGYALRLSGRRPCICNVPRLRSEANCSARLCASDTPMRLAAGRERQRNRAPTVHFLRLCVCAAALVNGGGYAH